MKNKIAVWVMGLVFFALLAAWGCCVYYGFDLVKNFESANVGSFGDFFGCFNALVSVLGFGAVIYTLRQQHKDSAEAEERHRENLRNDLKLRLFEKRYAISRAVDAFFMKATSAETIDQEDVLNFLHITKQGLFLFADPKICFYFRELTNIGDELTIAYKEYVVSVENAREPHLKKIANLLEVMRAKATELNNAFTPYLLIPILEGQDGKDFSAYIYSTEFKTMPVKDPPVKSGISL
jgi:hypothetical protein